MKEIIYFTPQFKEPYKHIYDMQNRALELITKYFKDKKDKGGNPYIEHLRTVAFSIRQYAETCCKDKYCDDAIFYNKAYIVALLHDIIEDTDMTRDILSKEGIDDVEILDAIESVTRQKNEKYFDFIKRVSKNNIGRIVKIYDLENNMDIKRMNTYGEYEKKRLNKYWWSWRYLLGIASENEVLKNI